MNATTEPEAGAPPHAGGRRSRTRAVLAAICLILACLTILVATVAVWAHQVAFKTDRFTALVSDTLDEPEVLEPLSAAITIQVVDALDVQARLENRLPDTLDPLAGPMTLALADGLERRVLVLLGEPRMQQALTRTVAFSHDRVMNLLRGESDAVTVVDGYVVVEMLPVAGVVLEQLQAAGVIPPEVQLPDLSTPMEPGPVAQTLGQRLGVTLPEDFGTIQLMPADRLLRAQAAVRAFDIVVVVLIVLALVLAGLAVWLAGDRRRMVVYLALGTIVAFLLARLTTNSVTDAVIDGIADEGLAGAIRSVVAAAVGDLRSWTLIIMVLTAILGVAAYLAGRPAWLENLTGRSDDATASTDPRRRRQLIERIGSAAIGFLLLWIALGPEIALIGAALIIGLQLALGGGGADEEPPASEKSAPASAV